MRSTIGFRMCVWGGGEQGNGRGQSSHLVHMTDLIPSFQVFQTFSVSPLLRQKLHPSSPTEKPAKAGWRLFM